MHIPLHSIKKQNKISYINKLRKLKYKIVYVAPFFVQIMPIKMGIHFSKISHEVLVAIDMFEFLVDDKYSLCLHLYGEKSEKLTCYM